MEMSMNELGDLKCLDYLKSIKQHVLVARDWLLQDVEEAYGEISTAADLLTYLIRQYERFLERCSS